MTTFAKMRERPSTATQEVDRKDSPENSGVVMADLGTDRGMSAGCGD